MNNVATIQCVDTHIEGLGVRVVTEGIDEFPGETMAAKREWFMEHADHLRRFLLHEPRGHSALSGAILQRPCREDADWGVLFIEVTGVLPMCGAGTMAVATMLVDTGMVAVTEPVTRVRLDTPIGLIVADVRVVEGKAASATIANVPSFVQQTGVDLTVPAMGDVEVDIAFGGNYYAFVELAKLGEDFDEVSSDRLIRMGRDIMKAVNEQARPVHPESGYSGCEHVVFIAPGSTAARTRHALINFPGWVDRSPGGTGTSALMALLHYRNQLPLHAELVNESFIGTTFTGRLLDEVTVGNVPAVLPEITGRAWIIGRSEFVLEPSDPFPAGFTI